MDGAPEQWYWFREKTETAGWALYIPTHDDGAVMDGAPERWWLVEETADGGFKAEVQQVKFNLHFSMPGRGHGKDGKQRAFPTFPRHDDGDLIELIKDICCT